MKGVAAKLNGHRPLARRNEGQHRVIGPDFRSIAEAVPRFRAGAVAGEQAALAVLDRLMRLAVAHRHLVRDRLSCVWRGFVRSNLVVVAHTYLPHRAWLAIGAACAESDDTRQRHDDPAHIPPGLLLVVLQPQMRDLLFAHEMSKRVLELRLLDEKIVLWLEARSSHRGFVIEA